MHYLERRPAGARIVTRSRDGLNLRRRASGAMMEGRARPGRREAPLLLTALVALALAVAPTPSPSATLPEERARWRALLQWPDACEADHASAVRILELTDGRVRAFDLGARRTLVEVGCAHGAYQDTLLYYLHDAARTPPKTTRLSLPGYEAVDDEWEPRELTDAAGEASFDAARRTLTLFTRARGLGDCGSVARYRVQGDKLALVDFRGRACDGEPEAAPPPDKWPRVFTLRPK